MWELFSILFSRRYTERHIFSFNNCAFDGRRYCVIEPDEIQDITPFYNDRCGVAAWRAGACEVDGPCV